MHRLPPGGSCRRTAPGHTHRLNALWLLPRGPNGRRGRSVAPVAITRPVRPLRTNAACLRLMYGKGFTPGVLLPSRGNRESAGISLALQSNTGVPPVLIVRLVTTARMGWPVALSRTQRLITQVAPRSWAASMEAESRAWMVRCRSCGFERSIWELGGIRWKAKGSKWTWGRCPHCGKRGWHKVYRRNEPEPSTAAMV